MSENLKKIPDEKDLKDILDKRLYLIKKNNFKYTEEFKKEYGFEFTELKSGNSIHLIIFEGESKRISKYSRIMAFINENTIIYKFIYNIAVLKKILNELKFEYFIYKDKDSNDSFDSEISDNKIVNIFYNIEIVELTRMQTPYQNIIEKFKNRYKDNIKLICDLSLNSSFYYPLCCKDELQLNFDDLIDKFEYFYNSESEILYLFGPKSSSKSIGLIYYCFWVLV